MQFHLPSQVVQCNMWYVGDSGTSRDLIISIGLEAYSYTVEFPTVPQMWKKHFAKCRNWDWKLWVPFVSGLVLIHERNIPAMCLKMNVWKKPREEAGKWTRSNCLSQPHPWEPWCLFWKNDRLEEKYAKCCGFPFCHFLSSDTIKIIGWRQNFPKPPKEWVSMIYLNSWVGVTEVSGGGKYK